MSSKKAGVQKGLPSERTRLSCHPTSCHIRPLRVRRSVVGADDDIVIIIIVIVIVDIFIVVIVAGAEVGIGVGIVPAIVVIIDVAWLDLITVERNAEMDFDILVSKRRCSAQEAERKCDGTGN